MSTTDLPLTVGQVLPWAVTFLKYTDDVIQGLPEDAQALDWRPTDEAGGWYLSLREQAMHIADSRHETLSSFTGEDVAARLFCTEFGGTRQPWVFKPAAKQQILESLAAGHAALEEWLAKPAAILTETTPQLQLEHERILGQLRDAGQDTAAREARGPGRIVNVLLFFTAHEQSHRSVLQGLLRQRGYEVVRYA